MKRDTRTVAFKVAAKRLGIPFEDYVSAIGRGEKICGHCLRSLPLTYDYYKVEARKTTGFRSQCRDCERTLCKERYDRLRGVKQEKRRAYYRRNKDRIHRYNRAHRRKRHAALRAEFLAAYGGCCACCGERQPMFLELDHVHNDGGDHRREFGTNVDILKDLRRKGWPKGDFQILCSNCNKGKAINGGVCPHVAIRTIEDHERLGSRRRAVLAVRATA